jgi:hypothetical protein
MKTIVPCFFVAVTLFLLNAHGQGRSNDFQITKINKNLITNPQYTYSGAEQYQANQRDRWLEVEVEFTAAPDFTDELTFKYFILVNGKVLTGEVTHANIAAGREKRSVMYVPPQALASFLGNRPVPPTAVQNIAVQIAQQGALKDELSLTSAAPRWCAACRSSLDFCSANETPFAPLYWDRYEQIGRARTDSSILMAAPPVSSA